MSVKVNPESDAEQLKQRNHELIILNEIAQALNRSVELDQALHTALAQAADLLGLHTGWAWLLSEESGAPYLASAQNLPPGLRQHPDLMDGSCYCLDTFLAGDLEGAANVNVITCSRLKKLVDGTDGLRYHASIPLYAHGRQLGVLNLASADWRELSAEDLRLLYTVGDLLSIAIERARLFARSAEFGATEERNRLAREIHDTLAQGLAGIALKLETADALLEAEANPQRVRAAVEQALSLTRANLEEARRSVLDLRAAPLEGHSLPEALQILAEEAWTKEGLKVICTIKGANHPLQTRVETGLYRIAQEALSNIRQHARANRADLLLETTPEQVRLIIEDEGRGFDPAKIPAGRFGLVGINERVRLMGGRLKLQTSVGEGTQLEVTIPIR